MHLKSIELNGFKSFGKKSAVEFTTPITSIVGPNGSGKSNIVEAIRFVLGEQSMKSLRGKGGVDLIFKGSKNMSKASSAKVSITFDNSKKVFAFTNSGSGLTLDYDEVTISREVFGDGVNRYSINGTEVRLKDVIDLLASVNIGSSGHHIISQGEADRVLNASSKDRRAMIEDALGLKIYQYRIKESERKLDKTLVNMKEVSSLRREIAPHINFLKKQVEKIEKAQSLREELGILYKTYLSTEATYINTETKRLAHARRILDENILSLDERIGRLPSADSHESNNHSQIQKLNQDASKLRSTLSDLSRTLGRLEAMIENANEELDGGSIPERVISEGEWISLIELCESHIDNAIQAGNLESSIEILRSLKQQLKELSGSNSKEKGNERYREVEAKIDTLTQERRKIMDEMDRLKEEESGIHKKVRELEEDDRNRASTLRDSEKVRYELLNERNEATSNLHSLKFEEEKLAQVKNMFETEVAEAGTLVGREALEYAQSGFKVEGNNIDRSLQEESRRKIERIKIKLEDAGIGNGGEVLKEYNDTVERDQFLAKELEDLNTSINSLRSLISDLKETLDSEFKSGVERINKQFQEFFALMFGGGTAFLSVIMEHKRPRKDEDMDMDEESENNDDGVELQFERGVEINVSLPHKKVKDLHMLSGGERSLTSIALLFAMSQVNPPPFLVLDETDAALDEANSRKYGNMLENLSKYSQLIVVTHNRETMSRAQVLYGVTMDSLGASKLLSIRLEDASTYAK